MITGININSLTEDERELIEYFRKADRTAKRHILTRAEEEVKQMPRMQAEIINLANWKNNDFMQL